MFVIKRNGSKEEFNAEKIENAILKAFDAQLYDLSIEDKAEIKAFCKSLNRNKEQSV